MARPSKLTPGRNEAILAALRAGCTRTAAAATAEIDYDRLNDWMNRYATFRQDVIRAEAQAEERFTKVILAAANPHEVVETTTTEGPEQTTVRTVVRREFDWRAAESWLKRRRRTEWGDTLDVRKLDDDTLLRLIAAAEGGGTKGPEGPT